jgi:hypothetical protein
MTTRLSLRLLWLLAACLPTAALAQHDDLHRVREQGVEQRFLHQDKQRLEQGADEQPVLAIDGQHNRVGRTSDDLGRALYVSLQQRQWEAARRLLDEYVQLTGHDPLLRHYAQGALARVRGQHRLAALEFKSVLLAQPDFLPAQLELARVLAEDHRDREAIGLFAAIASAIDTRDPNTQGVHATVHGYLRALHARQKWNGTIAAGPAWSDNINRSSASRTCLLGTGSDTCVIERRLPDQQIAGGLDYDGTLERRTPLSGHHGLHMRTTAAGQAWRGHRAYDEFGASARVGYSWRSARQSFEFAPGFDYQGWGGRALYGALGLHGQWSYALDAQTLLKLEGDWKRLRYRQRALADNYNGDARALYATWLRALNSCWTAFAGLDVSDNGAAVDSHGFLQRGLRLGITRQWRGATATVFGSLRERRHHAWAPMLEARRRDQEYNLIAIVRGERFAIAGLVPSLSLRFTRVASNVDWLHAYDRSLVSLKWERQF